MKEIVEIYKSAVIQIATPNATGTGFYLKTPQIIVTNNHVVEGNAEVIIEGRGLPRQMSRVLYTDARFDLAFLEISNAENFENLAAISLGDSEKLHEGDSVIAVGHPFGLQYSFTKGIVSTKNITNNIEYVQHDAALNPGNSGGPLLDAQGFVVGVNTFIYKQGNCIGFSLPARYLQETIDKFKMGGGEVGTRCGSCLTLVFKNTIDSDRYCPHCGSGVALASSIEPFRAEGTSMLVENMLTKAGYDVRLSRRGPDSWEVQQGSAKVLVTYHKQSGLIFCNAHLCALPSENIKDIYEYLLRENYRNSGLTLSVLGQDVVLSLLIFDRYLKEEIGLALLKNLIEKADYYDNVLIEKYGSSWLQKAP
jgi:serine protease Do